MHARARWKFINKSADIVVGESVFVAGLTAHLAAHFEALSALNVAGSKINIARAALYNALCYFTNINMPC